MARKSFRPADSTTRQQTAAETEAFVAARRRGA
jgi:hypothetical protein